MSMKATEMTICESNTTTTAALAVKLAMDIPNLPPTVWLRTSMAGTAFE